MISSATKTLQTNNKTIYVAILSTLTFFLFLDYIPGLQAWSAWVTPPVALFLGLIFALTCGQAHPKFNKKTSKKRFGCRLIKYWGFLQDWLGITPYVYLIKRHLNICCNIL